MHQPQMLLSKRVQDDIEAALFRPRIPLQDNRCSICLGDIYTCDCGKVKGKNLSMNYLTSTDEGDE